MSFYHFDKMTNQLPENALYGSLPEPKSIDAILGNYENDKKLLFVLLLLLID